MQDLVGVLLQCLHLHTGYHVVEPSELLIPGRGRCGQCSVNPTCKAPLLVQTKGGQHGLPTTRPRGAVPEPQALALRLAGCVQVLTWVAGHISSHLVVSVELLPP